MFCKCGQPASVFADFYTAPQRATRYPCCRDCATSGKANIVVDESDFASIIASGVCWCHTLWLTPHYCPQHGYVIEKGDPK